MLLFTYDFSFYLSSLCSRYLNVHTVNGSPLTVVGQDTLCSDSFHVIGASLVPDMTMHFMPGG
jgi:hypothetical protein